LACPVTFYANGDTRRCTACPTGCVTCDSLGCYTCASYYTYLSSALTCMKHCNNTAIYYYGNKCYNICPIGTYLSLDLVNCLVCSSGCASCFGTAGNCTTCADKYYYLGNCLDACPNNFYVDSSLVCTACSSNPSKC